MPLNVNLYRNYPYRKKIRSQTILLKGRIDLHNIFCLGSGKPTIHAIQRAEGSRPPWSRAKTETHSLSALRERPASRLSQEPSADLNISKRVLPGPSSAPSGLAKDNSRNKLSAGRRDWTLSAHSITRTASVERASWKPRSSSSYGLSRR